MTKKFEKEIEKHRKLHALDSGVLVDLINNFKEGTTQDSITLYIQNMQIEVDKQGVSACSKSKAASRIFSQNFSEISKNAAKLNELIHDLELFQDSNYNYIKK